MRGWFVLLGLGLFGCVKPEMGPYDLPRTGLGPVLDEPPVLRCDLVARKTIAKDVDEGDVVIQPVNSKAGKVLITALVRDGDRLDLVATSYRCGVH